MERETTIVYYTDGSFEGPVAEYVRNRLVASGYPVISVSQEPLDFGENYCIGKIGRSYESIQSQILMGIRRARTKYVALAEHDTLYPDGYFDFIPPVDTTFYYNKNKVFVILKRGPQYGMYIDYKGTHPVASQLICDRKLLIEAVEIRRNLLTRHTPEELPEGWGEPGYSFPHETYAWRTTEVPSIDIFHNDNFTTRYGQFDSKDLTPRINGWGTWDDVMGEKG